MIVYADRYRVVSPRAELRGVGPAGAGSDALRGHEETVSAWIVCGEICQGVLDAQFEARGGLDGFGPLELACSELMMAAARAVVDSYDGVRPDGNRVRALARSLSELPLPETVHCKVQEGFAHYAVYPETYILAARALRDQTPGELIVVGPRSIGLSLGAVVATAAQAETPVVSVRPAGPPFHRGIRADARLEALARRHAKASFAIVDEGPGLSGSTFAGVADWLQGLGVEASRIHVLPSHSGRPPLGTRADFWQRASIHHVPFEAVLWPGQRWHWAGAVEGGFRDVAAGRWRAERFAESAWPPVHVTQERRKFLWNTGRGERLARFVGLGPLGAQRWERAIALQEAGFTPEVEALRYGFLIGPWLGRAPVPADRPAFLRTLTRYLAFLNRGFPARDPAEGARPTQLMDMIVANAGEVAGEEARRGAERLWQTARELDRDARPVRIDGRLHAWEWLQLGDGRILKCDALDHHAGHDLVGAQDIAWDLAGAAVEHRLTESETRELAEGVERGSGHRSAARHLGFYRVAYVAFQAGLWSMAESCAGPAPDRHRAAMANQRYAGALRTLLGTV